MIEVTIDSVRVNLMSPQRLVILRETGSDRYLPIWVGQYEAEAITVGLQEVEVSRPLTHDLIKTSLQPSMPGSNASRSFRSRKISFMETSWPK